MHYWTLLGPPLAPVMRVAGEIPNLGAMTVALA